MDNTDDIKQHAIDPSNKGCGQVLLALIGVGVFFYILGVIFGLW